MSCLILLNSRAGTLFSGGIQDPVETVARAFREAGREADVQLVEPDEMDRRLGEAANSDHEIIVVGGGDGTFSHALGRLARSGKTLGLLPLGTMNLLGRDLAFPEEELGAMASALAQGEIRRIDLATINGRPFHTLCGLGYFSRVAREREETRLNIPFGRLVSVVLSTWRSVTKSGRLRIRIVTEGRSFQTQVYAALVTVNRIGNDWRRERLDEGLLELHLMRKAHLTGRAMAGFELVSGRWREGDSIESIPADWIDLHFRRPRVWLAVDGELRREETPLRLRIEKQAVQLLMPRTGD